ncbi:hypothetical protein PR202_ga23760 [Eleusine coracana subsp. coracana]|uniref:Uncharacterized protein n=1 Tax=Eleusine coracana subsp. coracana TaxID=191504 RepID=A0AAV5D510_ELECO|nr:hypothetical protein PR202_ga23760 [Eleusine coracana subsp. coracana]
MGFLLGAACLLNSENICAGIVGLVHSTTDGILRPGCVWLMGVPAGFKLNTELAELLGMISLNAVQIYSTLWFFMGGDDLSAHPIRDCSEKKTELLIHGQPESLVSELHCNYANLVEVIRSNYEEIFNRTGFSFCKQLAYGILSGERVPSSLHLRLSPPFPWMNTSILEYWLRCRSSVLSCAPRR